MPGVYVGAAVATLIRFIQSRERKLLPVLALFVLVAIALTRTPGSRSASLWHIAAGLSGLAVVFAVAPRPPSRH